MQTVLIVIHLMVVIALVAVVLLQRSEGGALGVGGSSGFMTGRGQANVLTRATAILATLFFATSLGLTLLANYGHGNKSIFDQTQPQTKSQPAPAALPPKQSDSVLDQLKKIEQQRANGGNGSQGESAPSAPAPTTSAQPKPAPAEPAGVPAKPADDVSKPKPEPSK